MANKLIERNEQFNKEVKRALDYVTKESMPDTLESAVLSGGLVNEGLLIAYDSFKAYEKLANEYALIINEMVVKLDSIQNQLNIINAKLLLEN